eukprot:10122336-Ditylum_brightwellii.AAC.1
MPSSTDADEKKNIAVGKKNVLAMVDLTLTLGTESCLNKVPNVSFNDWPGGIVYQLLAICPTYLPTQT